MVKKLTITQAKKLIEKKMKEKAEKGITKLYITSPNIENERTICYFVSKNNLFPIKIKRLTRWSWIVEVEYEKESDIKRILNETKLRNNKVSAKRVFKSSIPIPLYKNQEKSIGFIYQIIFGVEALIKKPVSIRITNNRANSWQRLLIEKWQYELDHPERFKKVGINPMADISQDGDLEFCLVSSKDTGKNSYLITYFNQPLDRYT